MDHVHERFLCRRCGAVVRQCRCISLNQDRHVPGPCYACEGKSDDYARIILAQRQQLVPTAAPLAPRRPLEVVDRLIAIIPMDPKDGTSTQLLRMHLGYVRHKSEYAPPENAQEAWGELKAVLDKYLGSPDHKDPPDHWRRTVGRIVRGEE